MTILVNKKEIESFVFPGGECSITLPKECISNSECCISADLTSSEEIMKLLLTVNALKKIDPLVEIDLKIPYFPYARQDRVCNKGEAFSLEVMTDLINGLDCRNVYIVDPHSPECQERIYNCQVTTIEHIFNHKNVKEFLTKENVMVISPDKGAKERVTNLSKLMGCDVLCANKVRDSKTGNIVLTELMGDPSGRNCLIVDDICDGGRTFIELSKVLKSKGCGKLYLYVTHGIFSNGLECLRNHFDRIYVYHFPVSRGRQENLIRCRIPYEKNPYLFCFRDVFEIKQE